MKKQFCIFLTILIICCITTTSFSAQNRYEVPIDNSPSQGPADAPVTIIKFLDYQ